ncbi:MAG: YebC/PmpR family DNA-binding transcriptional regulator [Clostridia bacterium]
MSGHSKWANIKRRKESVDSKRANVFSKLGKEIAVAVKVGGSGDISINSKLRDIVAKAKSQNMPNDNINRCIQKAAGDSNSANYEEITYEGFGPCGVAVIVESMTDNKNRAAADIRCIFNKSGGTMGQSGCVSYMFEKKGYILIEKSKNIDEDYLMMEVLDKGAEDFVSEDEYIEITSTPDKFSILREFIEKKGYLILEADIRQIANMKKELDTQQEEKLQNFLDKLDENDDVQNVWHDANM